MIQEIRVETLEDLLPLLTEQENRPELGRNRSSYLYRGMPDASYHMVTSLSRCCKNLQKKLEEVNAVKNLTNRVPAVVEVQKMIDQAKELPAVMEY